LDADPVFRLLRVGMTLFPNDLEGTRLTRTGSLQYLFAIAAFVFSYLGTLIASLRRVSGL
jgi:hypothetical protein